MKRRIHLLSGDKATGLDQVPESLFPLLACRNWLSLTASEIALTVVIFFVGEYLFPACLQDASARSSILGHFQDWCVRPFIMAGKNARLL